MNERSATESPTASQVHAQSCATVLERARAELARGSYEIATRLCEAILAEQPSNFGALMILGQALLRARRPLDALAAFDRASQAIPGNAAPFTLAALIRFRMTYGPPPAAAVTTGGPRLQCRGLGLDGRFGNQLLQYSFLRLYASRHELIAECPDWIGRDLYDLSDPLPSALLPTLSEEQVDWMGSLRGVTGTVHRDVDVRGYFCGDTRDWGAAEEDFRRLFTLGRRVAPAIHHALARLRQLGDTVVAVHVRRGDFAASGQWIAPLAWYLPWLREIRSSLSRPVIYLATDEPASAGEFGDLNPVMARDLGVDIAGASFLVDHEVLRDADVLAISNSTFSFTAAMLNSRARLFIRPNPSNQRLESFEPWKARVLLPIALGRHSTA